MKWSEQDASHMTTEEIYIYFNASCATHFLKDQKMAATDAITEQIKMVKRL